MLHRLVDLIVIEITLNHLNFLRIHLEHLEIHYELDNHLIYFYFPLIIYISIIYNIFIDCIICIPFRIFLP